MINQKNDDKRIFLQYIKQLAEGNNIRNTLGI